MLTEITEALHDCVCTDHEKKFRHHINAKAHTHTHTHIYTHTRESQMKTLKVR